ALAAERDLLAMILREQIANGTVTVQRLPTAAALQRLCVEQARRSLCRCVTLAGSDQPLTTEGLETIRLEVAAAAPVLRGVEPPRAPAPLDAAPNPSYDYQ